MKNNALIYLIFMLGLITACAGDPGAGREGISDGESKVASEGNSAEISFTDPVRDLGNITSGEQVVSYFKYTNTGDGPLVINSIKAGCGCTVPIWSKEPVPPGDKETIKVIFDSSGKKGNSNIRITVNSNARNPVVNLAIKAKVSDS